jgi:hypothetical protein
MPTMSLKQNIINNLSDSQRSFLRMPSKLSVVKVHPKPIKSPKSPKPKPMSSAHLQRKAAGYLLASANASKKGL